MALFVGKVSGDIRAILAEQQEELGGRIRAAVGGVAEGVQAILRAQVQAARLGTGLEKAWRIAEFRGKRGRSLGPSAVVYSKATRIHAAFDRGGTVTARGGKWLAIPLPEAIRRGLDRLPRRRDNEGFRSPGAIKPRWSDIDGARTVFDGLRFVEIGPGRALLVADASTTTRGGETEFRRGGGRRPNASVALFLLVRQVRVKKLLDLKAAEAAAQRMLDAALARAVE